MDFYAKFGTDLNLDWRVNRLNFDAQTSLNECEVGVHWNIWHIKRKIEEQLCVSFHNQALANCCNGHILVCPTRLSVMIEDDDLHSLLQRDPHTLNHFCNPEFITNV